MQKIMHVLCSLILAVAVFIAGCGGPGGQQAGTEAGSSSVAAGAEAPLTVKVLDVGQGDAILIRTGQQTILIDTGDDKYYEADKKGKVNDQLFEALAKENITTIDKLILTHAHADHIGKAAKVIERYDVKELVYNGIPSTNKMFINALKAAKQKDVKQVKVKAGDTLDFGNGVSFEVLSPDAALIEADTAAIKAGEKPEINNQSVVGKLTYGSFSMLLTGDAESAIEKAMVAAYGSRLQCQVLKSGHHGSKTSSSAELLRAVKPEVALMSCSEGNQYGHPHDVTIKKYDKAKIAHYATKDKGTITLTSDGKGYELSFEK